MSGLAYDTSELVTTLKDRGLIPTDQNLFDTASFLRSCTQQMWLDLCVDLLTVRNQYLIWVEDQTIVAAQSHYRIPHRAIGGKVEDVHIVNSDGSIRGLTQIPPQRLKDMLITSTSASSAPAYFYVENHEIVLFPAPASAGGTLRIKYPIRPGRLVPITEACKIATISVVGAYTNFYVSLSDTLPTTFNPAAGIQPVDFIAGKSGFQYLALGLTPFSVTTGVNGYVAILTTSLPSAPRVPIVGDWFTLAEESAVPQVPAEYHALLALLGLAAHANALCDFELADRAAKFADGERKMALSLITPRVNGQVRLTVNRNWFYGRRS